MHSRSRWSSPPAATTMTTRPIPPAPRRRRRRLRHHCRSPGHDRRRDHSGDHGRRDAGHDGVDIGDDGPGGRRGRPLGRLPRTRSSIQTDWFPESEHGGLYEMMGDGYTVDTGQHAGQGHADGRRPGHRHRPRDPHGRPGDRLPSAVASRSTPTTASTSPTPTPTPDAAPGVRRRWSRSSPRWRSTRRSSCWDPDTYPDIKTLADLGTKGVTINIFGGGYVRRRVRGRGHLGRTRSTRPTTARRPGSSPRTARSPSRASPRPSRTRTSTRSRSRASRWPTSC